MNTINTESMHKLVIALLIATLVITTFNSFRISSMNDAMPLVAAGRVSASSGSSSVLAGRSAGSVIPTGVPAIYGQELDVRFDDVSADDHQKADQTIRTLGLLDQQITLTLEQNQRYVNILYKQENGISCEYCCGARAVIFENGQPACGCAHSYAMRGLAKYLITRHGSEYTDAEILEEVGKWKTLFFPEQMELKAQVLASKGIKFNYINLASNKYRGIEQGASAGSMVGGC